MMPYKKGAVLEVGHALALELIRLEIAVEVTDAPKKEKKKEATNEDA